MSAEARQKVLIEAAVRCLGRGGIGNFTVDAVAAEAEVSRSLTGHHFAAMEDLLVAVYQHLTRRLSESLEQTLADAGDDPGRQLRFIVDASFAEDYYTEFPAGAWIALWGEAPKNRLLLAMQLEFQEKYLDALTAAIAAIMPEDAPATAAEDLAIATVALIDGLWLQNHLHPEAMTPARAKAICLGMLKAHLGPV